MNATTGATDVALAVLSLVRSAAVLLLLLGCFAGYGGLFFRRDRLHLRAAAGMLLVYLAVSILGFLGLISPAALWTILLVGALLALRSREDLAAAWADLRAPLLMAMLVLPLAALPPVSRDAMNHHLFLPRLWLESGHLVRPGFCFVFSYPRLGESVYALVGGTVGFASSRLVSLSGFVLAGSALWTAAREWRRGILALVLLASVPEAF
ncbi:hypothetical protein JW921_09415, partial [Candidatus Fermentibacterales bacterium]|nr:hypothetical protein [Candidatus Fermentibacterales bacterium]